MKNSEEPQVLTGFLPVKCAGTMTKSSKSQEDEFLLPPSDESFNSSPSASWWADVLTRSC